jgi:hypothetical protein
VEEQIEPDDRSEELREIGCHRSDLADDPHRNHDRFGCVIARELGQILSGHDAELRGESLKEHRHQICEYYHPEKPVAERRAALNVGCEVAGVHVRNRRYESRAGKGQERTQAAALSG